MHTNHIDKYIEAYLDSQLSSDLRQQVESHLHDCPACARQMAEAIRLQSELRPVLYAALGRPALPPYLHASVRTALEQRHAGRWFWLNWAATGRLVNAVGTVAVVAMLAVGSYVVIQGKIPGAVVAYPVQTTFWTAGGGSETPALAATPVISQLPPAAPAEPRQSAGDVLPQKTPAIGIKMLATPVQPEVHRQATLPATPAPKTPATPALPGGTIAYALYDGHQYQIHLINPDGSGHRLYPLPGVSEPALHPTSNNIPLAFRSWSDPVGTRALMSSDIQAKSPEAITNFWEDSQPDWSPTENRLIFASQRESDRRWRLYSVWGDGSLEVNLRREGQSPTFAPDGLRFAFESCDEAGQRCGLWVDDLNNSEYGAKSVLINPLLKAPDWSPVGETIAYMANPNDNWDIYLVNSDGSNTRRLTTDPAIDGLPAWSPDGEWLAFVSNRGGGWGLWLLRVANGQLYHTASFGKDSLTPPAELPYTEHGARNWWAEQISWGVLPPAVN